MGTRCAVPMVAGLTLLLCAACGDDAAVPVTPGGTNKGAAGGGQVMTSGSGALPTAGGGASGAGGRAAASNAGGGGDSNALHPLFTDGAVPDCLVAGAPWKLEGSIGGQRIMLGSDIYSSRLMVGELYVVGDPPGGNDGGVTESHHPLILTWDGSVAKGDVKPLTGKRFLMPGDRERPTGYCISAGEIGPSPYAPGVLFKFRIRSVRPYAMGQCMGAEQPATLTGCLIRTDNSLPR